MPLAIVASNFQVKNLLHFAQTYLNTGCLLRLFGNPINPTPATLATDFSESTFAGYAPFSLDGAFGAILSAGTGVYQMASPVLTFTATAPAVQSVYGWFITSAVNLLYSASFATPYAIFTATQIPVQIFLQEQSLVIPCP